MDTLKDIVSQAVTQAVHDNIGRIIEEQLREDHPGIVVEVNDLSKTQNTIRVAGMTPQPRYFMLKLSEMM